MHEATVTVKLFSGFHSITFSTDANDKQCIEIPIIDNSTDKFVILPSFNDLAFGANSSIVAGYLNATTVTIEGM